MKLFGRSSGYYLFWSGFIYFWVGIYLAFNNPELTHYATMWWVLSLSIPLWCPPVSRYFNMEPVMFNLFGKKDKSNVVDFPKLVEPTQPIPPKPEPKKEEPAKIYYRFGITDNNRVAFSMGYSEITMNKQGCQQMIDQLEFFKGQLYDEDDNGGGPDGDGGEPIPVPEQKAA
jgi:hypothetical protein